MSPEVSGMSTSPGSVVHSQAEIPVHHQSVDARGLACPLPILRAKKSPGHHAKWRGLAGLDH